MDEQICTVDEWMDIDRYTDYSQMDEQTDRWMDVWMARQINELYIDRWIDKSTDS